MSGFKGASNACILDALAYIPNCIGSYTHDLYEAEATQVSDKYNELMPLIQARDSLAGKINKKVEAGYIGVKEEKALSTVSEASGTQSTSEGLQDAVEANGKSTFAGLMIGLDKVVMFFALVIYRIGWWSTIFCQQILLGMLTIFGPIQWAFSVLPKWEGAWAKWITRYLTVHFYGAMLYFVGFYVLLLFDIVLSVQVENLTAITQGEGAMAAYILVPDLAAWMIPEGDTAFSTRNFGEGVASSVKASAASVMKI